MNIPHVEISIGRILLGFLLAPLMSSIVYAALTSWQGMGFLLLLFVSMTFSYTLTVAVMVPAFLLLVKFNRVSFGSITLTCSALLFGIFFALLTYLKHGFTTLRSAGEYLVYNGKITTKGHLISGEQALLVTACGLVGATIFYVCLTISFRTRPRPNQTKNRKPT